LSDDDLDSMAGQYELAKKQEVLCNLCGSLGEGRGGSLNTLFKNRSAIKLANIDALLGLTLTKL